MQRAGFEPANQYGLGPHPSAFDQAGQPLPSLCSGGLFLKATGAHFFRGELGGGDALLFK